MAEPFNVWDFLRQTSAGYNRPEGLQPDVQKMLQEVKNAAFAPPNRPVGAAPVMQAATQGTPLFTQLDTRLYPRMEQFKSEAGPRIPPGYAGAAPVAPVDEVAARMSKGSVPRNFWDGAIDRVFQPEPGPPQGINFGDRDFRAARAAADIVGGMRSGRGLSVAGGVGTLAGVAKEIYDERSSRLAEQARPYTLAATLEAARQGLPEQSLAARPMTSENVLSPVPGGALTTIGTPARKVAADMDRRMGPEAPLFSAAPGAPITFPTAMAGASAAEAGGTQSPLTGRVTPGMGTVPTAPGQQRGELDLTGMKFKDAFEFARRLAAREGVDATGRFLWNRQAYQTNVNPARGRERYVPESRQTRLGDLPQLAETITPAPVGARSADAVPPKRDALESLPDYESRRQAAQGYLDSRLAAGEGTLDQPIQVGRANIIPVGAGSAPSTMSGMPTLQEAASEATRTDQSSSGRGRVISAGELLDQPQELAPSPSATIRVIRRGVASEPESVPSEEGFRARSQRERQARGFVVPPDEKIEFDQSGRYARNISKSGTGEWADVAELKSWKQLPRGTGGEEPTTDAGVLSTAPWRYKVSEFPVVQNLWSRAMHQFGDLGVTTEVLESIKKKAEQKTTTTDIDTLTDVDTSGGTETDTVTVDAKGNVRSTRGGKTTSGEKVTNKNVSGSVTVQDIQSAIDRSNKSSNREAAKYDVIEKILQLDRQMRQSELQNQETKLKVRGAERKDTNELRYQEVLKELRTLRSDPRAKSEFAPLIQRLDDERYDLESMLGNK